MAASASKKRLAETMAASARAVADRRGANREKPVSVPDVPKPDIVGPTPEQFARARYELEDIVDRLRGVTSVKIGKAYKRRPTFEVLADDPHNLFSDAELKALRTYRMNADIADRSPLRDSLNKQRGGSGLGPTAAIISAMQVRDDCERAAGSLSDILRAVVIYDVTPSQWAMAVNGAVEECENRKGKRVCRMRPRDKALVIAKLEIQMAAQRVLAELDA